MEKIFGVKLGVKYYSQVTYTLMVSPAVLSSENDDGNVDELGEK